MNFIDELKKLYNNGLTVFSLSKKLEKVGRTMTTELDSYFNLVQA